MTETEYPTPHCLVCGELLNEPKNVNSEDEDPFYMAMCSNCRKIWSVEYDFLTEPEIKSVRLEGKLGW